MALVIKPKEALLKGTGVPGAPKGGKVAKKGKDAIVATFGTTTFSQVLTQIAPKDIKTLLGKGTFPVYLDFSYPQFQLETDAFLTSVPNILKELDLSNSSLQDINALGQLSKLKRLSVDNNLIRSINLKGLVSLEYLSLSGNRLEQVPDMSDMKKLVYLDLSANRLTAGFTEIIKVKTLRVLDLSLNDFNYPINEFYNLILVPIKRIPKLEYVSFYGNPMENLIKEFKFFVINELTKTIKYFDWDVVTRDERNKARKLEETGLWDDHLLPVKGGSSDTSNFFGKVMKNASASSDEGKGKGLEMLLQDNDTAQVPVAAVSSSVLDEIMSGKDPLDEILSGLISPKDGAAGSDIFAPFPSKDFPLPPDSDDLVDSTFMKALDDVLANDLKHLIKEDPMFATPEFADILSDVLKEKESSESRAISSPSLGRAGAGKNLDINYLDLLEDLMKQHNEEASQRPPSQQIVKETSKVVVEESKEDILDRLIRSQDERLQKLVKSLETPANSVRFEFSWESLSEEATIGARVGVGTYGETFRGLWRGMECSVKVVNESYNNLYAAIRAESEQLIPLRHQHLASYLGLCIHPTFFILQEFVNGINLYGLIHNKSLDMELSTIIKIATGVAQAISYLHSNKVIHRSLKPKNILLDPEFSPKVRDWALCSLKDSYQRTYFNTAEFKDVEYLAPELLSGLRNEYTEKIDVYAFGVMLWQMFTRQDVYPGLSQKQIATAVSQQNLRPAMPYCPSAFQALIRACWSREPEDRPAFTTICKILAKPVDTLEVYKAKEDLSRTTPDFTPTSQQTYTQPISPTTPAATPQKGLPPKVETPKWTMPSQETQDSPEYMEKINALLERIQEYLESPSDVAQMKGLKSISVVAKGEESIDLIMNSPIATEAIQLIDSKYENVQEAAINALLILADHEAFPDTFRDYGGFGHLGALLEMGNEPIMMIATKLLAKVVAKNDENKDAVRKEGIIAPVANMLRSSNEFLQNSAVWALSYLLEISENQDEFIAEGGLSPLLKLMLISNAGMQIRVMTALGHLITNERAQDRVLRAGVLTRYWSFVISNTPLLQVLGTRFVSNFTTDARVRDTLLQEIGSSIFVTLLGMFANKNDELVANCVDILNNICQDDQPRNYLRSLDGISQLLMLLNRPNEDVQISVLLLLANLAATQENRESMRLLGAIPAFIFLLSPGLNIDIQTSSLKVVETLAQDEDCWDLLITSGVVERLVQFLPMNTSEVQQRAVKILSVLCTDDEVQVHIVKFGGIAGLFNILQVVTMEAVVTDAMFILSNMAGKPELRKYMHAQNILRVVSLSLETPFLEMQEYGLRILGLYATEQQYHSPLIAEALLTVFNFLSGDEEVLISLSLKVILMLAANTKNQYELVVAGAIERLDALVDSPHPTIKLASQKAKGLIQSTN